MKPPPAAVTTSPANLPVDPPPPSGGTIVGCEPGQTYVYNLKGSQNIVLQHGIWSSACAWGRMAGWINTDFLIDNEIIPSLNSNGALGTSQGTALVNEINSVGGTNYILIGHSQGGLVSRYTAQYFQGLGTFPPPVKGVLTIDTPHLGANLTLNSPLLASSLLVYFGVGLWDRDGCVTIYDNFGCFMAALMAASSVAIEPALQAGAIGSSWPQLNPGSSFLTNLNAQPETFKQAAIIGLTPQRWAFTRIAGNFLVSAVEGTACDPEDTGCGERAIANDTEEFYDAVVVSYLFWELEAAIDCSDGDEEDCDNDQEAADFYAEIIIWMNAIDAVWDGVIDLPGDGTSDAIVQGPSQYYPYSTAAQYVINSADSHTGALLSTYDHSAVDAALKSNLFNVPTPASCSSFGVSGSPDSVSDAAATGSFTVATASACQWTASSQVTWLSVTSPSTETGTGSGTVDFTVAANPSTVPRSGSIQVGNGISTALFTVNQGATCTYALSVGLTVTAPAAGGSGQVTVTTTQDCPWSATVTAGTGWLTVSPVIGGSAFAAGTGTGSFTWTAAQNTTGGDLVGSINVMGQTFAIIQGSPVGTPGTGTVTFGGAGQAYTFNPCAGLLYPASNNCPQTIYNGGTITVTVEGTPYTIGYGGNMPTSALALSLISAINGSPGSLVTATQAGSGNVVVLVSVISGAATNYTLSASETYNAEYFTSPSYGAALSGAQLTGGTN